MARPGEAWVAMAARRAFGPSLPPSLADAARLGTARYGRVRVRLGRVRLGTAEHGSQTVARRASAFPATLTRVDVVRRSAAGCGSAWQGKARPGAAWAADSSTEPLRRFPAALIRGQTRQARSRRVLVRFGPVWRVSAWHGLTISAQGASAPSAGFSGIQTRRDTLRQSWASFGSAWHDTARTDELSTEGASLPYWAHSTHFMA